jgi:hypothetical protein
MKFAKLPGLPAFGPLVLDAINGNEKNLDREIEPDVDDTRSFRFFDDIEPVVTDGLTLAQNSVVETF